MASLRGARDKIANRFCAGATKQSRLSSWRTCWIASLTLATTLMVWVASAHAAPDPAFTQFIASLWPEAQAQGVSRATFERETAGLEPDYKLPDLILPGRPLTGA